MVASECTTKATFFVNHKKKTAKLKNKNKKKNIAMVIYVETTKGLCLQCLFFFEFGGVFWGVISPHSVLFNVNLRCGKKIPHFWFPRI